MAPLKQTNILWRGFAYIKLCPGSRLSTRLFARGIHKPNAAKSAKNKKDKILACNDPSFVAQTTLKELASSLAEATRHITARSSP